MPTDVTYWLSILVAGGVGGIAYWTFAEGRRVLARIRKR